MSCHGVERSDDRPFTVNLFRVNPSGRSDETIFSYQRYEPYGSYQRYSGLALLVHLKLLKHLRFIFIFSHFSSKPLSGKKLRTFETDELLLVVASTFGELESVGKVGLSSAGSF